MGVESSYPPIPTHEPHFWEFLTQSELQATFALSFVSTSSEYTSIYPLLRYVQGGANDDWVELTRAAARYLALEHGYLFSGVRVDLNSTLHLERVVEPRNIISVMQGKSGKMPINPLAALRNTIEWVRDRIPSLDVEPLKSAINDIQESVKIMRENIGDEELQQEAEVRVRALRALHEDGKKGGWV